MGSSTPAAKADWIEKVQGLSKCEWTEEVLDLTKLKMFRIDEQAKGYQRPLNDAFIEARTGDAFDAAEARTVFVSRRKDGSLYVLDGQHTVEMLLRKGVTHWLCRVFIGLTVGQEAARFAEYQENSQRMSPIVSHNASVIAGNKASVAIDAALEKFNLRISNLAGLRMKEGYIPLMIQGALRSIYDMGGQPLLETVLGICTDAWGAEKNSYNGRILKGLAHLLYVADRPFSRARLVAVLNNTTPKLILESVVGEMGSGSAGSKVASKMWTLYYLGVPGGEYPAIKRNSTQIPRLATPARAVEHEWLMD